MAKKKVAAALVTVVAVTVVAAAVAQGLRQISHSIDEALDDFGL